MKLRFALIGILLVSGISGWFLRGRIAAFLFQPTASDLAYGTASAAQKLDLYVPKDGKGPFPVVLYIHGGVSSSGTSANLSAVSSRASRPARARHRACVLNYRMAGEAIFPAAVSDARSAVRWLRANAAALNLDPARIGVWGKSAGGYLATMTAVTDTISDFDDPAIAPGVSSRVAALVVMYGPSDFLQMDQQLRSSPCGASAAA